MKNFEDFLRTLDFEKLDKFVLQNVDDIHKPMDSTEQRLFELRRTIGLIGLYHEWANSENP